MRRQGMSVHEWALSGTYDQDRPVLIDVHDQTQYVTRRIATDLTYRLCRYFQPGSTVCIFAENNIYYPVLVLAIVAADCRWTGANPAYTTPEISQYLSAVNPQYIIATASTLHKIETVVQTTLPQCSAEIILFTNLSQDASANLSKYRCLHDLIDEEYVNTASDPAPFQDDSIAVLMATAGTTSAPKVVQRSHHAIIQDARVRVRDQMASNPDGGDVRRLYCTPMYHSFSFADMVLNSLHMGWASYICSRFDENFPQLVADNTITEMLVTPTIVVALSRMESEKSRLLRSLRTIWCGSALLTRPVREKFLRLFEVPPSLRSPWGMTEYGRVTTVEQLGPGDEDSVGYPVEGCEIRTNPEGVIQLMSGQYVGELWIKGPQLMSGYLNASDNTTDTSCMTKDGWFQTGDVGHITDGKVYLVDRIKDVIKVEDWSVSASELEAAICEHPAIEEAAVVGTSIGSDEHPVAFVIAKPQCEVTGRQVKKHLLRFLMPQKVIKCEIRFVTELPKSRLGKILRATLREQLRSELNDLEQ